MASTIRSKVTDALFWTTNTYLEADRGKSAVRLSDMYLGDIEKHTARGNPDLVKPSYVCSISWIPDDPGTPSVQAGKKHDGLFVLVEDEFIVARDYGWARTIVEFGSVNPGMAEPATVAIKGKETPAFRLRSEPGGLFALSPLYGSDKTRTALRDRIVALINGEMQAAPGQVSLNSPGRSAVLRLVGPGEEGDRRSPPLDGHGELLLPSDEAVLYKGTHLVEVARNEVIAFGSNWSDMAAPSSPALVTVTTSRVAVTWTDWRTEAVAEEFLARRRRAGFTDGQPPVAIAGQLTWHWVSAMFVTSPDTEGLCSLQFQATDRINLVRLRLMRLGAAEAQGLLREISSAVAGFRLHHDTTLTSEDVVQLSGVRDKTSPVKELDWGLMVDLPGSYLIARED